MTTMKEYGAMHILAISGSLNDRGTITTLVRAIAALAPEDMQVTLYDGLGEPAPFQPRSRP